MAAFDDFESYLNACVTCYRKGDLVGARKEYNSAAIVLPLIPESKTGTVEFKLANEQFARLDGLLRRAEQRHSTSSAASDSNNPRFKVSCFKRRGEL